MRQSSSPYFTTRTLHLMPMRRTKSMFSSHIQLGLKHKKDIKAGTSQLSQVNPSLIFAAWRREWGTTEISHHSFLPSLIAFLIQYESILICADKGPINPMCWIEQITGNQLTRLKKKINSNNENYNRTQNKHSTKRIHSRAHAVLSQIFQVATVKVNLRGWETSYPHTH